MIIVSMAVMASRIQNLPKVLRGLAKQVVRLDKVLLYYSSEPWHHDTGMDTLPVADTYGLSVETIKVPNIGSSRKYLHSIGQFRNTDASILLLDDDIQWHPWLIWLLRDHHTQYRPVVGTRGWSEFSIRTEADQDLFWRVNESTVSASNIVKPTEVLVLSSGWATMFRAKDVDARIFDQELQISMQLGYSDEIFLATMLPGRKYVIPMPRGYRRKLESPGALSKSPETLVAKARQARLLIQQRCLEEKQFITV